MNSLKDNWFSEIDEELWPGHCFSLKCDQLLYNQKSKYQDVLVFNKFGKNTAGQNSFVTEIIFGKF